jgi:lipoprotein-anchoring transpeptidase ErfK/SrfK
MRKALRTIFVLLVAALFPSLTLTVPAGARSTLETEIVPFDGFNPGTVVIRTSERHLYLVLGPRYALRYPIAVGKPGKEWAGDTVIARKVAFPTWAAPEVVHIDHPELPTLIPPGPSNPLGPRALVLAAGEYAIHGTNHPETIGTKASYGCIRMYNRDIVDLFQRVAVGTPVVVEQ